MASIYNSSSVYNQIKDIEKSNEILRERGGRKYERGGGEEGGDGMREKRREKDRRNERERESERTRRGKENEGKKRRLIQHSKYNTSIPTKNKRYNPFKHSINARCQQLLLFTFLAIFFLSFIVQISSNFANYL